jgi:hypothetical protein
MMQATAAGLLVVSWQISQDRAAGKLMVMSWQIKAEASS